MLNFTVNIILLSSMKFLRKKNSSPEDFGRKKFGSNSYTLIKAMRSLEKHMAIFQTKKASSDLLFTKPLFTLNPPSILKHSSINRNFMQNSFSYREISAEFLRRSVFQTRLVITWVINRAN